MRSVADARGKSSFPATAGCTEDPLCSGAPQPGDDYAGPRLALATTCVLQLKAFLREALRVLPHIQKAKEPVLYFWAQGLWSLALQLLLSLARLECDFFGRS